MSRSIAAHLLRAIAIPASLAVAALQTNAAPVSVSATTTSFAPGSGYGVDVNEGSGTLVYVLFDGAFSANFVLHQAGDSASFQVGTVQLLEPNSHGGINANETNSLDVVASLTFTSPLMSLVQVHGTGTATSGSVSDAAADLTIDWSPVQVAFGMGGMLDVSLNDLTFTGLQTLKQTATITLVNVSSARIASTVPEPGSVALMGAALAGLTFTRRRRQ